MAALEDKELKDVLEMALWQVEEAKKLDLSISKAMNFINLSKEAQGYGNKRLAIGLIVKAKDSLFNDIVDLNIGCLKDPNDIISKLRLERKINQARTIFNRGEVKDAYDLLMASSNNEKECLEPTDPTPKPDPTAEKYSEALDSLQKVWLKMKQEDGGDKDMSKAKKLIRDAKTSLSKGKYDHVLQLCQEVMDSIQSPQDRLKEEAEDTIREISKTLRALFPDQPRSPKERFFKKQIEELITQAKDRLMKERPVEAINASRKAREILLKLEQESIKGDIPKMIIELRSSLDELKQGQVDISYEDYILKQVEETFWRGEYIKSRKLANKLSSITANAKVHVRVSALSSRLIDLNDHLKEQAGQDGYLQAREYIDQAKVLMDKSAYDMASSLLDKVSNIIEN